MGFPTKGKCAAWSSHWPPLPVLTVVIVAQNSGHRCSTICGLRVALLPNASRSHFALTTCSVLFFPLYTIVPTTQGAQTRSFRRSGTDRPFRPICSSPSADSNRCVRFLLIYPLCDQHTMLPTGCSFETNLSRASLLDARSPAVHLQRLGWLLVSATIFNPWLQLCASSKRTYAYITRSHRTPPVGVQSQGIHNDRFTRTVAGNRILA